MNTLYLGKFILLQNKFLFKPSGQQLKILAASQSCDLEGDDLKYPVLRSSWEFDSSPTESNVAIYFPVVATEGS